MKKIILLLVFLISVGLTNKVNAQDAMLGEVKMFAGNFAPRGWALCDGQLLAISQNQALFSLLGTMYGGDGRTTFALPDLRGRAPIHAGNGPGLTPKRIGEKGGKEKIEYKEGSNIGETQPYAVINYIIAVRGFYPSRN